MRRLLVSVVLPLAAACGDDAVTSDAGPRCPVTADPHDEDGDGIVDECDNCPAHPNPTQSDSTEVEVRAFADGVGDVCDLRPGVSGDKLQAFYAFASETDANAWIGDGFTISGDALHASGSAMWTSTRAMPSGGLVVFAQIASLVPGAQGEFVIAFDGDGTTAGTWCSLAAQQISAHEGASVMATDLSSAIVPGEPVTFVAWRASLYTPQGRAGRITCRVIRDELMTEATLMVVDDLISGAHAIAARDVMVDVTSASVYTSPLPKNP